MSNADEIEKWKTIANALFQLLDDIDTAEDIAKSNNKLFRSLVHKTHLKRYDFAETDGYNVKFKGVNDETQLIKC